MSASYDKTIKVWAEEAGDWYCAMTLGEDTIPQSIPSSSGGGIVHTSTVWCVGFAPGGVRFFSGSDDGAMAIWKLYTATERKKLFPNEQVGCIFDRWVMEMCGTITRCSFELCRVFD